MIRGSAQKEVLNAARDWACDDGAGPYLVTVVDTMGSAPRPAGSMMAVAGDGRFVGSVTGGCLENELAQRIVDEMPRLPRVVQLGVGAADRAQAGLPCGGKITVVVEPNPGAAQLDEILCALSNGQFIRRTLEISSGRSYLAAATEDAPLSFDGAALDMVYGMPWRLFLIGANQIGEYLVQLAQTVDFQVTVCDSRHDFLQSWHPGGETLVAGAPEECLEAAGLDRHCAVVAVGHEPNLEDLSLCAALQSKAFYVGALGSRLNDKKRRDRLVRFLGVASTDIERLRGPVGLAISSRTPAEIAVSIVADLIACRAALSRFRRN